MKRKPKANAKPKRKPPCQGGTKVGKKVVAMALRAHKGCLYLAAKALKITPQTIHNYRRRWPALDALIAEEKEGMKDVAEIALYDLVVNRNLKAIVFFLTMQAQDRGYVRRHQHAHQGNVRLVLTEEIVDASDARADDPPAPGASGVPL